MKNIFLSLVSFVFISANAFAYVPASAVTTMAIPVYGVYTSADPSCTTGMIATIPLTLTPQLINFAKHAAIGTGPTSNTIQCVVIVTGNDLTNGWAAGNYTGTSANGGGASYPDSNCNAGGANTGQTICGNGGPQSVSWPAQITADAAAIGLTLATPTCVGSNSEIVPLVLSTNAACTGQSAADSLVAGCVPPHNMNNYHLPTTANDTTYGTKLVTPTGTGDLKFVVDPSNTLGGSGASSCGNISAPLFSFKDQT